MTMQEHGVSDRPDENGAALVLAGGMALGAYQAGAYAALEGDGRISPDWLAGSSAGAVNAALIAGSPPERRTANLREFWTSQMAAGLAGAWNRAPSSHLQNWMNAIAARLLGVPRQFRPRLSLNPFEPFKSMYDLAPLRQHLAELIDYGRLNEGAIRVSVATTDIESGDTIVFDTGRGARLGADHLLASCGFLPEFAPLEIDGRLLGDGGLSANAPVEVVLADSETRPFVFVLDLYARDGLRPTSFEDAVRRKSELLFSNQTYCMLQALLRIQELRAKSNGNAAMPRIAYLSYRASPEEAGPEAPFDYGQPSIEERWRAGMLDMQHALRGVCDREDSEALTVVRR